LRIHLPSEAVPARVLSQNYIIRSWQTIMCEIGISLMVKANNLLLAAMRSHILADGP